MKIETLNTQIKLLQGNNQGIDRNDIDNTTNFMENEVVAHLINLSENENKPTNDETLTSEITALNNKVEKLEHLVSKYKDSLKTSKEKNSQLTTEIQMLSAEIEDKNKENEQLKITAIHLTEAKQKIQQLNDVNEELQNKINTFDFTKTKEISTLEIDLQKSEREIKELREKIVILTKREEENAISLAENKLSIHKELESKESEIKSLKDSLSASKKEVQSLNIVITDYRTAVSSLEEEKSKLSNNINELTLANNKLSELEVHIQELRLKCQSLENYKTKAKEEYKCLQLQLKQETAEKLAMIDRNAYLENRNAQLTEENGKKSLQVNHLESELQMIKKDKKNTCDTDDELMKSKLMEEVATWKSKYSNLESEIQEEREELVKLQSEIEKLLANYELIQTQNVDLHNVMSGLKSENTKLQEKIFKGDKIRSSCENMLSKIKSMQIIIAAVLQETKTFREMNTDTICNLKENIDQLLENASQTSEIDLVKATYEELKCNYNVLKDEFNMISDQCVKTTNELDTLRNENNDLIFKLQICETDSVSIKKEMHEINKQYESTLDELKLVSSEKQKVEQQFKEIENKCELLLTAVKSHKEEYISAIETSKALKEENNNMHAQLQNFDESSKVLNTEINVLRKEKQELTKQLNTLQEESSTFINKTKLSENANVSLSTELSMLQLENDNIIVKVNLLEEKINALSNANKDLEFENQMLRKDNKDTSDMYNLLEEETNMLKIKITESEQENKLLSTEVNKLRNEVKVLMDNFNTLETENDELKKNAQKIEETIVYNDKLEENIKVLTQENISLKTQSESISRNILELQSEISDVRKSHTEIEIEKDRLNSVIEKLEQSERDVTEKDTQTDLLNKQSNKATNTTELDKVESVEIKQLKESNAELSNQLLQQNVEKENNQLLKESEQKIQYQSLNDEYNSLKEENRRLHSDIAGLQTYLSKISKENSTLNDKLRALIASSENSPDKNELRDLGDSKNEIELGKEKIDELIRENTLLAEENLELKDQLNSQNYAKSTTNVNNAKDLNQVNLKEQYNKLLESKTMLEKRVNDLEDMNKSVNGNMQQMQDNNEKLRLSNEKLGRRLDEALVSLRHLHSLQENTELEYLRNILYEYLTGSGTHSVTLAKVLAAVVKFDDTQTRQILQKEKERQGFVSIFNNLYTSHR